MNHGYGCWLSPDGKDIQVGFMGHAEIGYEIMDDLGLKDAPKSSHETLFELNWANVTTYRKKFNVTSRFPLTTKQKKYIGKQIKELRDDFDHYAFVEAGIEKEAENWIDAIRVLNGD